MARSVRFFHETGAPFICSKDSRLRSVDGANCYNLFIFLERVGLNRLLPRPKVIAVSGFSSNVGKTTLVCDLLERLPGWEAIKLTRGHYRSCGRDPVSCCVSDLLSDEPLVLSGRDSNYESRKDTGRFWDAGASNVHWVIVNDEQVQAGIAEALSRVKADGVIVEGNSFLEYITPDISIMCSRAEGGTIKPSARKVLPSCHFLYLSVVDGTQTEARQEFERFCASHSTGKIDLSALRVVTHDDLPLLVSRVCGSGDPTQPSAAKRGDRQYEA
ncbi:MAG: hypothetical protein C5B55_02740 [Blastocatellia bacterium]|nr:MAG: hypothetical protein C5B55_02740 [Blastocatellia bacterium]